MPTKISQLSEYTTITGSAFAPIVDVLESASSKNKKITVDDLRKLFYVNAAGSSSFTKHTPGLYYFGDNSDGKAFYTGSITTLRTIISGSGKRGFGSTQDGPPVIKNFSSLFVSNSVVIKPTNRCRGMLIFVDGDATISGSISMTTRGAKFTGSDASFTVVNPPYLGDYWSTLNFPTSSYLSRVFAVGASGGTAGSPATNVNGGTGGTGILGRSGGGGGGGSTGASQLGGAGAAGTSFSGGAGGGGGGNNPVNGNAGNGSGFGGRGGLGGSGGGGGGAGNPAGPSGAGSVDVAQSGTGGLLILIVRGNLKIGPNGSITSNGNSGAFGGASPSAAGGGGSGGGIVYVYYGGNLTNNGTISANGGSGGSKFGPSPTVGTGGSGGSGGAGTVTTSKLNTAFPVAN